MSVPDVMVCTAALSIVLSPIDRVKATEEITATSPASAIGVEGDLDVPAGGGPGRLQFLFRAVDFALVPPTHRTIAGFAWRPDAMSLSITDPVTVEARFRLSSTPVSNLGATFAANRGPDGGPVVFDGILTFQTDNQPPGPGPKNFDYSFEFQQPFDYDPRTGDNLLLEFEILAEGSQVGNWFIDAISTPGRVSGLSASDLDVAEGRLRDSTWPAEFTFVNSQQLQPGDADMDLDFDQFDLVQVQIAAKYLTGQSATWGDGDWNGAPGGEPGDPPAGNGLFDQLDIIAALAPGHYLTGPYGVIAKNGAEGDRQTSIIYDQTTGEVGVDAPAGVALTSVNIDSASGIFTGDPAQNLGGSFDNDDDNNIFKATFGDSFGSLSFGNVAQTGLSEDFVANDLTVVGSLAGGGDLGSVDLIYVPEPSTMVPLALALAGMLATQRRRLS